MVTIRHPQAYLSTCFTQSILSLHNYYITAFLMYDSQSGSVRIRCGHSATSYSWSKSDDGSAANAVILDTSSDKYTVVDGNSLDISLDNITRVDGGLYHRCVYGGLGTSPQLCVYVLIIGFQRMITLMEIP